MPSADTGGLGCDGDPVALTAATRPGIEGIGAGCATTGLPRRPTRPAGGE